MPQQDHMDCRKMGRGLPLYVGLLLLNVRDQAGVVSPHALQVRDLQAAGL